MRFYNNDLSEVYRKQRNLGRTAFLLEFPNLIITIIVAISSQTLICWADTAVSLSNTLHGALVFYIANKMRKETGDNYNYGMDRLEVFISFICDLSVFFGMLVIMGVSVYGFFEPKLPTDSLAVYLILKGSNTFWDIYLYLGQRKLAKKHDSRMNDTELGTHLKNTIVDMTVALIACVCYFFRTKIWVAYLSPAVTILLVGYFVIKYIVTIRDSVNELADFSIPIKLQDDIYDVVLAHREEVEKITAVNCHTLNKKIYIDICLDFKADTSYNQQKEFLSKIEEEIHKFIKNGIVEIVHSNEGDKL